MSPSFPVERLDAIVFDLGGVLLDLDFSRTVDALTRLYGRDASSLYDRLHQAELFDRFERGEIEPATFRAELGGLFGASARLPAAEIDAAWNALLGHLPEEKLELLAWLRPRTRTFLLSNTNVIHLERFSLDYEERHAARHGPWSALFERPYYSHELGLRKPEPRIFERLLELHGLTPSRCLFVDDNPTNVEAARQLGLRAVLHPTNAPLTGYFR